MQDEYKADDRLDDEEGEFPGQPITAKAIAIMWAERDARYVADGARITADQVQIIRDGRMRECLDLPPGERAKAWVIAKTWVPL